MEFRKKQLLLNEEIVRTALVRHDESNSNCTTGIISYKATTPFFSVLF